MVTFILVTAVVLTTACVAVWALVLALIAVSAVAGLRSLVSKCASS